MASINVLGADGVTIDASQITETTTVPVNEDRTKAITRRCQREFANKVNKACKNKTGQNVASEYTSVDLVEPEKEIFPRMLQVDFYRGLVNESKEEYNPESNFAGCEEKWKGDKIDFNKIHAPIGKERCRCASLVGGAGSGKTTLLRRYARRVLEGKIRLGARSRRLSLQRRENFIVHFINVRELPDDGNFTPRDLLFKELVKELSEDEVEIGYERLKSHHDRCLFVVDGLDQYDWELEREERKIGYYDEASVSCVIYNLLTGELFPNAWVLSSSRPHKIRYFENKLRANKMITLSGFEPQDVKYLADEMPKTDKTVYRRLCERCPNLLILCRTPIFLVFTILVFIQQKDFSSDTMAAVMVVLIQSFGKSPHWTANEYQTIFKNLKCLAFKGTVARKVIFKEADFESVELNSSMANDLFVCIPKKTRILVRQKMFKGDFVMFFCHQSVQEAFCSFYVCEMPVDEFEEFVNNNLNEPHFSVVRRLLCGILLNEATLEATGELISIEDLERKREILLATLEKKMLEEKHGPRQLLDLLSALYEAGSGADVLFRAFPRRVSISREALSVADSYVLGKSLAKLTLLDLLELWETNIDREQMEVLWKEIRNSRLKIKKMDLHSNYQHDFDCGLLGSILHHCEVEDLDINDCDLTDAKLEKFGSAQCEKLKRLAVGKNRQIGVSGISILGQLIGRSQEFDELEIDNCDLTKPKIKAFRTSLGGAKIDKLDINYNRKMGDRGAIAMGKLVCECRTTKLDMSRCDQSHSEIRSFAKGLKNSQLTTLSITTHELRKFVTKKYLPAITALLPHVSDRLEMLDWDIPQDNLASLQKSVNTLNRPGFTLVYSSLPGKEISCDQALNN